VQEEAFKEFDMYIKFKGEYLPKNSVGFKGKIYVLTSSNVYSAAEGFSVFCKDSGFATLVGERTGGDGIGGDPMLFCLPNSGILGRYPVYYGMNAQGVLNEEFKTAPDYQVDYKFDSKSEITDLSLDPCIQAVIKLEKL
jgi:C-terminal processing protease CtpA/Prc